MSDAPKKRAPAFQFYADDFLGGTFTMNNEEKGAYITLLCIQWSKGFVSKNDFDRVAMAMPPHSQAICQGKFQTDAEGNMRNTRLEAERSKQAEYRAKQSGNAQKRWVGNATAMPPHSQASATALPTDMPNACSPSPSPSPSPIPTPSPKEDIGASAPARPRFVVPTRDELDLHAAKIGLPSVEVDKFVGYYTSNGWKVGKNPMKSWVGAMATWSAKWREQNGHINPNRGASRPDAIANRNAFIAGADAIRARLATPDPTQNDNDRPPWGP